MQFPSDPPKLPGWQVFGSRYRYPISPLESQVNAPRINCVEDNCAGYFGSLIYAHAINFDGGMIVPLESYPQTLEYLSTICNKDRFLYPPQEFFVQFDPATGAPGHIEQPRSWKPADSFSLPPTHQLILDGIKIDDKVREDAGIFILGLMSMAFETILQFHKWIVDSKVLLKPASRDVWFSDTALSAFLSSAIRGWNVWPSKTRIEMSNVLQLHCRIEVYGQTWDKFLALYLIFDGLFSICSDLFKLRATNHKARFKVLCDHFGISYFQEAVDEIYWLRNDLFHHLKWDKGKFGLTEPTLTWWRAIDLRKLTRMLILGVGGYRGKALETNWTDSSSLSIW